MRTLLLCLALLVAGCHAQRPWHQSARIAVNGAAHALALADVVIAERYERQAAAVAALPALDALDARYEPARLALRGTAATLRTAERTVVTAQALGDAAAKCRARAGMLAVSADLGAVLREVRGLGADVPAELPAAVEAVGQAAATLFPGCVSSGGAQ